jgi:hypothetical protein
VNQKKEAMDVFNIEIQQGKQQKIKLHLATRKELTFLTLLTNYRDF